MIEIGFLGTGGSVAKEERDNTSFILNKDGEKVLVDIPGSAFQKIKKLNFEPKEVKSILVTHIHPDHIYGLPSFVHSLMLEECVIPLYGSEETVGFCRELLDLFGLREEKYKCRIDFIPLKEGQEVRVGKALEFTAFETPHSSSSLAFHFFLQNRRKSFLYSGDTPPYPPLFERAKGIHCLLHDCSAPSRFFEMYPSLKALHTDSLELGRWSQEAEVKCLIPCHFFGEVDYPILEIEEEIREHFQGRLIIPRDLAKIGLS